MMTENGSGFAEIEHTADWALKVWAPNLSSLFSAAAQGMYWLMETSLQAEPRVERTVALSGADAESLLVLFLSELLYFGESEGLGFDRLTVVFRDTHLQAQLSGAPIAEQKKEIKAVTYHNLRVQPVPEGFVVTIVFDV